MSENRNNGKQLENLVRTTAKKYETLGQNILFNYGRYTEQQIRALSKKYPLISEMNSNSQNKREIDLILLKNGFMGKTEVIYCCIADYSTANLEKVRSDIEKLKILQYNVRQFLPLLRIVYKTDSIIDKITRPKLDSISKYISHEKAKKIIEEKRERKRGISKSNRNNKTGNMIISSAHPYWRYNFGQIYLHRNQLYVIKHISNAEEIEKYNKGAMKYFLLSHPAKVYYITRNSYTKDALQYLKKEKVRTFTLKEWREHNR